MNFDHIKRCLDLTERDFDAALDDRDICRALVLRIAAVARPETGAPKVLLLFARMAKLGCYWLEGTLRVELMGDAETTTLEVMTDSAGLRERVFAPVALAVGLPEFAKAVARLPHMIDPLELVASTKRRMVFVAEIDEQESDETPAIARESLYESTSPSQPPVTPLTFSLRTPVDSWAPQPATKPSSPPGGRTEPAPPPSSTSLPAEDGWDDWGDLLSKK